MTRRTRPWRRALILGVFLLCFVLPSVWAENVTVTVMVEVEDDVIAGVITLDGQGLLYETNGMTTSVRIPWGAIVRWTGQASFPRLSVTWARDQVPAEKGQDYIAKQPHVSFRFPVASEYKRMLHEFQQHVPTRETPS